ncbi:MAG: hypothetical protein LQ345_001484 [Seirophora villosa]|nr:MAG: hypothetical protein LQ345_001484 [Seirophora villosa]
MAAPQIPNLNTLKRGSGRPFGHGHGAPSSTSEEDYAAKDKIVQQTDQDASVSRLSAVELGYLDDPFAKLFVSGNGNQRRFPIINRGTYVRTTAIDNLVHRFLSSPSSSAARKQIISFGAGSDTRFFRLRTQAPPFPAFTYHELDFASNTAQKIATIARSPALRALIVNDDGEEEYTISEDLTALSSPHYNIIPFDLRTLSSTDDDTTTALSPIDPTLPTLLLSECCLVYLSPPHADATIRHFTHALFPPSTPVGLILYEPINPSTPFGKVMVANLAARGIVLQTLRKYGSEEAQAERLRGYGFSAGRRVRTVGKLWEEGVGQGEKERVAGLEMVDEVEEWVLLAGHYCVGWGWRDGADGGVWEGWRGGGGEEEYE